MKNALATYIYPEAIRFLNDFLSCYSDSTVKIKLLLFNDGAEIKYLQNELRKNKVLDYQIIDAKSPTPALVRKKSITYFLKNNFKKIIFADIDDTFSKNRIEMSLKGLEISDFVFNNVRVVDKNLELIDNSFFPSANVIPKKIYSYKQILIKNFLGFSNTAVNVKILEDIEIPPDIIAVDWWIYSVLLLKNYEGTFIDDTFTNYRQHSKNIIGANKEINIETLKYQLSIVKKHFYHLNRKYKVKEFQNYYEKITNLVNNEKGIALLLDKINQGKGNLLWWEWLKYL